MARRKPAAAPLASAEEAPRLTVPEMSEGLRLTPEQLQVLDDVASGKPVNGRPPGTREIMQALALKAQMSVARPKPEGAPEDRVPINVVDPFATGCTCPCTCGARKT